MSFHSILEGFALGVQDTTTRILTLFLSLLLHKAIEAFSVGLQVSRGKPPLRTFLVTIFIYSIMTPIGSLIGIFVQELDISTVHKDATIVVLESLAAGTFIYVTFLEVLAQEKANDHNSLKQLVAIVVGFLAISAIQFIFGRHGDHAGHGSPHPTTSSPQRQSMLYH